VNRGSTRTSDRIEHARSSISLAGEANCKDFAVLPDGRYETIVVDARAEADVVVVELAVAAGDHRGDVVGVRMTGTRLDPVALLGLPAVLVVEGGRPRVTLDT
jgi:predicted ester cyclase